MLDWKQLFSPAPTTLLCRVYSLETYDRFGKPLPPKLFLCSTKDKTLAAGDYVEFEKKDGHLLGKIEATKLYRDDELPSIHIPMHPILRLIKKHNTPSSAERSSLGKLSTKGNEQEDICLDGLFSCLDQLPCEVQETLTEEQVTHFEQINHIKLPVQYREMLLKEGNGLRIHYKTPEDSVFHGKVLYRIVSGIPWDKKIPNNRLSRPFPFEGMLNGYEEHLEESFAQFNDCLQDTFPDVDDICTICDHRHECIRSISEPYIFGRPYRNTPFYNGTLEIYDAGCTYSYHLILNGLHRGEVWFSDENSRFLPQFKSFKEFLEHLCHSECIT